MQPQHSGFGSVTVPRVIARTQGHYNLKGVMHYDKIN
nr:MAG TPA: hypothetical protein [Caudoviricetes sp.]